MKRLRRVRPCDGQCCKESPRFPNVDKTDCVYHDNGCALMRGEAEVPDGESYILPGRTAREVYEETCMNWPHNLPDRPTGGCCWQWQPKP